MVLSLFFWYQVISDDLQIIHFYYYDLLLIILHIFSFIIVAFF